MMMKNFEKSFPEERKHSFQAHFFVIVLLISNHTVFLVQFGINMHLWVFQKIETEHSQIKLETVWYL